MEDEMTLFDTLAGNGAEEHREDSGDGVLVECFYCLCLLRIDGDGKDFEVSAPEIHCDACTTEAIKNLCGRR